MIELIYTDEKSLFCTFFVIEILRVMLFALKVKSVTHIVKSPNLTDEQLLNPHKNFNPDLALIINRLHIIYYLK